MTETAQQLVPAAPHEMSATAHLTREEAEYVYNIEVLGLPNRKAADLAGLPIGSATKPHILQARELTRKEIRGTVGFTKEDVLHGVHEAIGRAKMFAEPATEIKGWEFIARLLGYEESKKIDVNMRETVNVVQHGVRSLSDEQLIQLVPEASNVIDADFYVVKKGE